MARIEIVNFVTEDFAHCRRMKKYSAGHGERYSAVRAAFGKKPPRDDCGELGEFATCLPEHALRQGVPGIGSGQDSRTVSGSHDTTTTTTAQPTGNCQLSPATLVDSMITNTAAVSSQSGRVR